MNLHIGKGWDSRGGGKRGRSYTLEFMSLILLQYGIAAFVLGCEGFLLRLDLRGCKLGMLLTEGMVDAF